MSCKQCGRCCRELIIEVELADAEREPRIKTEGQALYDYYDSTLINAYRLSTPDHGCVFLAGNECLIYETRPDVCRSFEPGSEQCWTLA